MDRRIEASWLRKLVMCSKCVVYMREYVVFLQGAQAEKNVRPCWAVGVGRSPRRCSNGLGTVLS